ncbi:MAG: DUF5056 domain-containing protein [Prevotella sp.]|nr:DUF5056 domain-containing protein [Prevotella sp.]
MADNDNIIVERFFSEMSQTEIVDNGFSHRVMRSIPSRTERLARMWTILCIAVSVALFFIFDVWKIILLNIEIFLRTLPTVELSPSMLVNAFVVFAVIISAAVYATIQHERLDLFRE